MALYADEDAERIGIPSNARRSLGHSEEGMKMKKVLLGSTALVAAATLTSGGALAAEKIKLGLGGYYEHHIVVGATHYNSGENTGLANVRDGIENYTDAEIWFTGATTLDNGITITVQVELEAASNPTANTDVIDESYVRISGNFGTVLVGSENMPNYLMHYSAPSVSRWTLEESDSGVFFTRNNAGITGTSSGAAVSQADTAYGTTSGRFYANDAMHAAYYTPRVMGFQLGVGWAPDSNEGNAVVTTAFESGLSVGANYVQKVLGTDVAASFGYIKWFETPTAVTTGVNTGQRHKEPVAQLYQSGLNLGWGGLTIGGGVAWTNYAATTVSTNSSKSWTTTFGGRYVTGPWGFSLNGSFSEADVEARTATAATGNAGADSRGVARMWRGLASTSYALSPGVTLLGEVMYQDEDGEIKKGLDDISGWLFAAGFRLDF